MHGTKAACNLHAGYQRQAGDKDMKSQGGAGRVSPHPAVGPAGRRGPGELLGSAFPSAPGQGQAPSWGGAQAARWMMQGARAEPRRHLDPSLKAAPRYSGPCTPHPAPEQHGGQVAADPAGPTPPIWFETPARL